MAVARDGVRQVTQSEPWYDPQMIAVLCVYLGYLAILGVLVGLAHLLRPQRCGGALWWWFVLPPVVTGAGVALSARAIGVGVIGLWSFVSDREEVGGFGHAWLTATEGMWMSRLSSRAGPWRAHTRRLLSAMEMSASASLPRKSGPPVRRQSAGHS
ncbi:hypothetical protein [Streptomyces sp. NPDC050388]|uniref:hypothetical protein n=1 Tax=Streptomyces sp. NPDC050388 TaxID=3155781 RepID=UPI003426980E